MKALIIAYGSMKSSQRLIAEAATSDVIICADGGLEHAERCGIIPDFMIGDFDSVSRETLDKFKAAGVKGISYPSEKDYTDTEICVEKALDLGADEICIAAGIGSRLDHSLGNVGLLHIMLLRHIKGKIISDGSEVYICNREGLTLKGEAGDIVSVIPYGGDVSGITLKGLKYPLEDAMIPLGRPIGVSNVMVQTECSISIGMGEIIVIHYRNI